MNYKKPSIAYLLFNSKNNGGNRVIFEQANRLKKRGYRVKIYSFIPLKPNWFPLKVKIESFLTFLYSKPDILIATFWPTAYLAFFFPARCKFYLVQGIESAFYKNLLLKKLAQLALKFPLRKIAVSSYVRKQIDQISADKSPVYQLDGSGIDQTIFKPRPKHSRNKAIKILSVVSSYSFAKGVDLLSSAVKKIKYLNPNYFFTLVTPESKSPSDIFDRFVSNPLQYRLAKLYQESDILLSTSRSEGFFLPGLEAMACGCILITTDSGGVRDYGLNMRNCLMIGSPEELWKKNIIGKLIADKKLKNKLIQNGYETAKRYNWDKIIDRLENIFFSCL